MSRLGTWAPGHLGGRDIDVIFVDDRYIAALAGEFRGSPFPTDVLAFDYADAPGFLTQALRRLRAQGRVVSAEIFISLDTAARQAKKRGVPLKDELTLLCLHGLLHVSGYDDESLSAWRLMRRAEFENMMRIL